MRIAERAVIAKVVFAFSESLNTVNSLAMSRRLRAKLWWQILPVKVPVNAYEMRNGFRVFAHEV